ncbi:MAG: DUF5103 domain-containing protein [Lacibacter sp.]
MNVQRLAFLWILYGMLFAQKTSAQNNDCIYQPNIRSVKLHAYADQLSYPILKLNSTDRIELHFDDLDADVKYYSYTFVLCNADWTTAPISQFDYMRGFANVRINTYRNASIALTRYTHYSAILPDKNTFPTRSGNYLLKVFTNGDTSKTVFTKRFLVVDMKAGIAATVLQPFNTAFAKTHQKIQFSINVQSIKPTNVFQQIKVVILQNFRWDQSIKNIQPTFIRQNILEYNTENESLFPAQKEWRWLNLTSLRLQTDRIEKGDYTNKGQTLYVKPDGDRNGLRYMYYRDANGFCQYSTIEPINPYWQGDYATVWFRYLPSNKQPIKEQDVYLYGELTNYELTEAHKLNYNPETGFYENKQMLKQGLYDYIYLLKNKKTGTIASDLTEGNWFETENNYTILVYYRPLGGRADELIAISLINSIANRPSMENRLL